MPNFFRLWFNSITMQNEREKIINFTLRIPEEVTFTYGYNIANSFPVHFHTSYTAGLILKGKRYFNYQGKETLLKENDVFIIQPFEPHSCSSALDDPQSYKIFSLNFLDNKLPYFASMKLDSDLLSDDLRKLFALAEYQNNSDELADLFAGIKSTLLKCGSLPDPVNERQIKKVQIRQAKEYIQENCLNKISLEETAYSCNMSMFHFERIFHQFTGMSPYAYLLFSRVKKTQEMLKKGINVTEAAYEAGFFDQSHFIRLFKKHVGVTPGNFIRSNSRFYTNNR